MIVAIGCDVVEHDTTIRLKWESSASVQKRVFSKNELEIYSLKKEISFLSGRFAAKEAILKCFGTGMEDGIALTDIQILQAETGKPIIELQGKAKLIAEAMSISSWNISITHSSKQSIAFVVAESL